VRHDPQEIADQFVNKHGIAGALSAVSEGKMQANREGDYYTLSVYREVLVILRSRAAGI
jgi:hypothetical protein